MDLRVHWTVHQRGIHLVLLMAAQKECLLADQWAWKWVHQTVDEMVAQMVDQMADWLVAH